MEGYRVLIGNLQDSTWYEEIPVTRINFSHFLNGPGKCDISTSPNPETESLRDKISTDFLKPGRSTIYIEKNGVIVGAYILWELFVIYPSNRLRLIGEGFWSYFRRRIIDEDLNFDDVDQLLIGKTLIANALAYTRGSIVDMSTSGTKVTSGVNIDRQYFQYQRRLYGEAVEDLADRDDGFDFDITSQWIGGSSPPSIAVEYQQYYPQKGTIGDIVFDLDANILRFQWQQKAQKFVSKMYMIGAGTAGDTTLAQVENVGVFAEGYPLLEHKLIKKDISSTITLSQYALRELNKRKQLYEIVQVEVDPRSIETRVGSFTTGDTVRLKINRGFVVINKYYRIMMYDVWVNEGANDERISVSLGSVEATL